MRHGDADTSEQLDAFGNRVDRNGLVGVDLDDCRDPESGAIKPTALSIVNSLNSYTEISPSGRGLHILVRGALPAGARRRGNVEMYAEGRYFTVTGDHLDGAPASIEERSDQLADLHRAIFVTPSTTNTRARRDLDDATVVERGRTGPNGAKFSRLWSGDTSGYGSHSEADLALCSLLAYSTGRDPARIDNVFRQSGLMRPKWDEPRGEHTYGQLTIARAIGASRETSDELPSRQTSEQRESHENQATQLFHLAIREGVELFRDDDDTAYIDLAQTGHREIHLLKSKRARSWLAGRYFRDSKKAPGSQALSDAFTLLEVYALQSTPRRVGVRICRQGDTVYLDLADDKWRGVEIDKESWRILARSPVPFKRPKGVRPLPEPVRGGSINELRPFLNVDDDDFVLIVAFMLGCLRGRKPYPILVINGEHGAAKSSLTAMIRSLLDPNDAPLRAEPSDTRDLMIQASNSHLVSYDNLTHIRLADDLSRLATGAGFSTRMLYENGEEAIFSAARPIILNGIPELAGQPDLVSRSLFVTAPAINDADRRDEEELWAAFEAARPRILGAFLDLVSIALGRFRTIHLPRKPRMADFAIWLAAAELGCPWPEGRFLNLYALNRTGAVDSVLEGDIVAATAEALAPWEGTATDFLTAINERATDDQKKQRNWFRGPRQARDALSRLAPALRERGINVVLGEKDNTRKRNRLIRLERAVRPSSAASVAFHVANTPGRFAGRNADESVNASALTPTDFTQVEPVPDDPDDPDDARCTHSTSKDEHDERTADIGAKPQR
jgi:hypothetical protein